MGIYLSLKVKDEDDLRCIPATEVKKERGRLLIYNGTRLVGEFPEEAVEHWALEEMGESES